MLLLAVLLLAFSNINCSEKSGLTSEQLKKIDEQVQETSFAQQFEQAKTKGCFATFFETFAAVTTSSPQTRYDYVRCLRTMKQVYPAHYEQADNFLIKQRTDGLDNDKYSTTQELSTYCEEIRPFLREKDNPSPVVCYKKKRCADGVVRPKKVCPQVYDSLVLLYALQQDAGVEPKYHHVPFRT